MEALRLELPTDVLDEEGTDEPLLGPVMGPLPDVVERVDEVERVTVLVITVVVEISVVIVVVVSVELLDALLPEVDGTVDVDKLVAEDIGGALVVLMLYGAVEVAEKETLLESPDVGYVKGVVELVFE